MFWLFSFFAIKNNMSEYLIVTKHFITFHIICRSGIASAHLCETLTLLFSRKPLRILGVRAEGRGPSQQLRARRGSGRCESGNHGGGKTDGAAFSLS